MRQAQQYLSRYYVVWVGTWMRSPNRDYVLAREQQAINRQGVQ